jgi:glycosyltransferase involved in cell wall biosynthesis
MEHSQPLVSIGIPTYNRGALLHRSIDSALSQDFENIEIIISDNASTDETPQVCKSYCARDRRIKYIRQPTNVGPTTNFNEALKHASGLFFMWLGDDDWIDTSYVRTCVEHLTDDATLSLISGLAKYYRDGREVGRGEVMCLMQNQWYWRLISYYTQVADNGIFYGLMRSADLRDLTLQNTMGGDWLLIASILSRGRAKTTTSTSLHRDIGGLTSSYQRIAVSLGLRRRQAAFPMLSVASAAWLELVRDGAVYRKHRRLTRVLLGSAVFVAIALKPVEFKLRRAKVRFSMVMGRFFRFSS